MAKASLLRIPKLDSRVILRDVRNMAQMAMFLGIPRKVVTLE